jgi:hypothetical protein
MNFKIKCETHNHTCLDVNYDEYLIDIIKDYMMVVRHQSGCTLSYKWTDGLDVITLDPEAVLAVSSEELETEKEAKRQEVKSEAQEKILALISEVDQRNALAHAISLLRKAIQIQSGVDPITVLSQEEQEKYDSLDLAWNTVKDIRQKSNLIEEEDIDSAQTLLELSKVKIKNSPKW